MCSVSRFRFGFSTTLRVERSYCWHFSMGRYHCWKRLEVRISNKPIESPFQIAKCVLESFSPIFLLIEALGDGIVFNFVILNPTNQPKIFVILNATNQHKIVIDLLTLLDIWSSNILYAMILTYKVAWNISQVVCYSLDP